MVLRLLLLALGSFATGVGALRASVALESYVLLAIGMVLLLAAASLVVFQPRPVQPITA